MLGVLTGNPSISTGLLTHGASGQLGARSVSKPPGFGPLISVTQLPDSTHLNSPLLRRGFGTSPQDSSIDTWKRDATDAPRAVL